MEFLSSSLWVPASATFPWFKTKILSARIIVDNLWAITRVVLFLVKFIIALWTFSSDSESNDEVASSNSIIGEFFKTALAIEILCFCPPDNFIPFSPIIVSYACGNFLINSLAEAKSQAF